MLFVPFVPEVGIMYAYCVYHTKRRRVLLLSLSLSSMLIFSQSLFFYHIALLFIMRKTRQKAIERGSHPLSLLFNFRTYQNISTQNHYFIFLFLGHFPAFFYLNLTSFFKILLTLKLEIMEINDLKIQMRLLFLAFL